MKISKRLCRRVEETISNHIMELANKIDSEYRAAKITHEVWDRLHLAVCNKASFLPAVVLLELETYRGKRKTK